MAALLKEISTITAKGQTTVPKSVRQALDVGQGDQIAFIVDEHGVTVQRADTVEIDPVIDSFLGFLARDMETHPETIIGFPPALRSRIVNLTKGMKADPHGPIAGEVDL